MKITKRQLRRIIKEERARLMEQPDAPDIMGAMGGGKFQPRTEQSPQPSRSSGVHMSGRNQNAMEQLHTAIDALIGALGNDEARQELLGIVEEWEVGEDY